MLTASNLVEIGVRDYGVEFLYLYETAIRNAQAMGKDVEEETVKRGSAYLIHWIYEAREEKDEDEAYD